MWRRKAHCPSGAFSGGVAANTGIRKALESALGMEVEVPDHYDVMGAVGAAVLARNAGQELPEPALPALPSGTAPLPVRAGSAVTVQITVK